MNKEQWENKVMIDFALGKNAIYLKWCLSLCFNHETNAVDQWRKIRDEIFTQANENNDKVKPSLG